jgi:hypothetical protein
MLVAPSLATTAWNLPSTAGSATQRSATPRKVTRAKEDLDISRLASRGASTVALCSWQQWRGTRGESRLNERGKARVGGAADLLLEE